MNIKVTGLLAIFLLIGVSVGAGYYWGTHGSDDRITAIRDDAERDSVQADSVRAELEDSLAALADSMATIESHTDTIVRIVRPAAQEHAEQAGEGLTEHLKARDDTVGLRLWSDVQESAQEVILTYQQEVSGLRSQLQIMDDRLRLTEAIVVEQDSLIARLRVNFRQMTEEAERWQRKANPPFHVKLLKDGWKFGAGVVGGYLIGKA